MLPGSPLALPTSPARVLVSALVSLCSAGAGSFPGSDILALVTQVSLHLHSSVDELLQRDR